MSATGDGTVFTMLTATSRRRLSMVCDPFTPRTKLDFTAAGIVDALTDPVGGPEVPTAVIRASIVAHGGSVRDLSNAMKALRNMGYHITGVKAGNKSWYKLEGTLDDEFEDHRRRMNREFYSQIVTVARALAGALHLNPHSRSLQETHRHMTLAAISLGMDDAVGKTPTEIDDDLKPIGSAVVTTATAT